MPSPSNIDDYIAGCPTGVQDRLSLIRATIRAAAPDAKEAIKYGMPAFTRRGNLVYFGAFRNHIGFYPIPVGVKEFEADLSRYQTGKGSIQFPHDQPVPLDLIGRIVKYRMMKIAGRAR
jgi:uncharacterized protein YdhG (YjbR/CyaY superfamily)